MTMDGGSTWPEQDAVDSWLEKYNINVDHKTSMELKEAVTAHRLAIDKERISLRSRIKELEEDVAEWREKADEHSRSKHTLGIIIDKLDSRIKKLEGLVVDTMGFAIEGWSYASDYFKYKWNYNEELESLRGRLHKAGKE
jgi:hypothetical protein